MRKILLLSTMILVLSTNVWGQSISKQINDIKRSKEYLTAEATMDTQVKAYEIAEELLAKQIGEYISEKKTLKNAPNVIVKDVAGKAEKLQMSRGTMTRVFLFVKKSDVIAADNTRVLVQPQNTQLDNKKESLQEDCETVENSVPQKSIEMEQTVKKEDAPISTVEPLENDRPTLSGNESLRLKTAWKQTAIDELLASSSITDARAKMNRLRAELKLKRYGSPDNCKEPEKCFWIIFNENEEIITILGPGNSERTNFRSLTIDSLKNYSGLGAMWFTFAN